MIRQPSSAARLYDWHRRALLDPSTPRHDAIPECGWYRCRLVKGGPWVAVEIRVERDIDGDTGELTAPERLVAILDGDRRDPRSIWTLLRPISRDEHRALLARRETIPAMAATMARFDLTANINSMRPQR